MQELENNLSYAKILAHFQSLYNLSYTQILTHFQSLYNLSYTQILIHFQSLYNLSYTQILAHFQCIEHYLNLLAFKQNFAEIATTCSGTRRKVETFKKNIFIFSHVIVCHPNHHCICSRSLEPVPMFPKRGGQSSETKELVLEAASTVSVNHVNCFLMFM